ncbi:MAG: single-stranded-DNA-specific exonuclease RecJ, partial [Anaerolineae bacterium]
SMSKPWHIQPSVEPSDALRQVAGHPLVARLLVQRGITDPDDAAAFVDATRYRPASPWDLPGMHDAVALLGEARARGWPVRVWGDLDADGETATAVLVEALRAADLEVLFDLPSRREGHGLRRRAFPRLVGGANVPDAPVVLTCDTGVSDADLAAEAKAAGYRLIITDHHDLPDLLPDADALVNPKLLDKTHPMRELAGVGVAYQVARALLDDEAHQATLDAMLDLVAVGLVADVAIQVRDVRYLIQRGLEVLREGGRPGLAALADAAGLDRRHITARDLGYRLGPRLNAAGRLAHARQGVELLLARDPAKARELAYGLEALNSERQAITEATQRAVEATLEHHPELVRDRPAIVVDGEGWEPGVIGLVAGALTEQYDRPAIVIRRGADGVAGGSARSVEGVDIRAAIMSQESLLLGGGGHPMAAGFSIANEHIEAFRHGLWDWLERHVPERPVKAPLEVEAVVSWQALDLGLARALERLAPHGAGNPEPVLASFDGKLVRVEDVSTQRETPHRRLHIADERGQLHEVLWFNAGELPMSEQPIDVAYTLSVNRYRDRESLQLTLADWCPAGEQAGGAASWRAVSLPVLAEGREIVDLRTAPSSEGTLASLRARYGDALAAWAEATESPVDHALPRQRLTPEVGQHLAVAFAPPDAATLREVVRKANPTRVYLLRPVPSLAWEVRDLLRQVAGMARWAIYHDDDQVALERMAARVGLSEAAILASLRVLEAAGSITLEAAGDGWRVALGQGEAASVVQRREIQKALARHLEETAAFRDAYPALDPYTLLSE